MAFRDNIRKLAFNLRKLPGERFQIRPYTVAVVVTTWAGTRIGEGAKTETTTAITEAGGQPPKVRWLSDQEKALAGYSDATVEVGPITPDFPGGGTSWATLMQTAAPVRSTVHYLLTGPEFPSGARFERIGWRSDKTFGYRIRLQRVAT